MNRHFIVFIVALTGLVVTGCQSNAPQLKKDTIDLVVNQKNWAFDKGTNMYSCFFDVPEITANVYNYGEVSVSHEYNGKTNKAYQVALPETTYLCDSILDTEVVYYTQYIDFRIGVGYVDIQITNSDYLYSQENPESMLFRLQSGSDILDLNIQQENWMYDEDSKQYYYRFDVPEITEEAYNFGQWSVSREYNAGTNEAYQVALPTSCYLTDTVQIPTAIHYSRHIDYIVGVGYVGIFLTLSDFNYTGYTPEAMSFRLQITY